MTMGQIISGSRPTPLLMERVWFNSNRAFSRFEFIFSNPRQVRGGFTYCYSHPASIIFSKYFFIILFYTLI